MTSSDKFVMAILAAAVVVLLCLVAIVLLGVHLLLSFTAKSSANARGFRKLAISWWVVGILGFLAGPFLLPEASQTRGLQVLILLAGIAFPIAMGGLASWTGKQRERLPESTAQNSERVSRLVYFWILGAVTTIVVGWGLGSWLIATNRYKRAQKLQEEAQQRSTEERLAMQAEHQKHFRLLEMQQTCFRFASDLDWLATYDIASNGFPASVRIPDFANDDVNGLALRLEKGTLNAKDIGPKEPPFPCLQDHRLPILRAYARGLVRLDLWTLDVEACSLAQSVLTHVTWQPGFAGKFIQHLDSLALIAIEHQKSDELDRAAKLCALARAIKQAAGESDGSFAKGGCRRLAAALPN